MSVASRRSIYFAAAVVPALVALLVLFLSPASLEAVSGALFPLVGGGGGGGSSHGNPATGGAGPHTLPALPYAYDALEPYFDEETMRIHHAKHHQAYVNNLNAALRDEPALAALAAEDLVGRLARVPAARRAAVRNSAGGHVNHGLFWRGLRPGGAALAADAALARALAAAFGNVDAFRAEFERAAAAVFGSGWAWLVRGPDGALRVATTPNQDCPLMGAAVVGAAAAGTPILALDVWEHAYYLKYRNQRPDYIKAFWSVVDWDEANARFEASSKP